MNKFSSSFLQMCTGDKKVNMSIRPRPTVCVCSLSFSLSFPISMTLILFPTKTLSFLITLISFLESDQTDLQQAFA